jgi:hypothetical protein
MPYLKKLLKTRDFIMDSKYNKLKKVIISKAKKIGILEDKKQFRNIPED